MDQVLEKRIGVVPFRVIRKWVTPIMEECNFLLEICGLRQLGRLARVLDENGMPGNGQGALILRIAVVNELVVCGTKLDYPSWAAEVDLNVPTGHHFGLLVVAMASPVAKRLEPDTLEFVRYEFCSHLEALLPRSAPLALRGQV